MLLVLSVSLEVSVIDSLASVRVGLAHHLVLLGHEVGHVSVSRELAAHVVLLQIVHLRATLVGHLLALHLVDDLLHVLTRALEC